MKNKKNKRNQNLKIEKNQLKMKKRKEQKNRFENKVFEKMQKELNENFLRFPFL